MTDIERTMEKVETQQAQILARLDEIAAKQKELEKRLGGSLSAVEEVEVRDIARQWHDSLSRRERPRLRSGSRT